MKQPDAYPPRRITINEAARWLAAMAAMDGVVSPNERRLIREFATTYGVDPRSIYRMAYAIANNVAVPEVEFMERTQMMGRMFEGFVAGLCADKSHTRLIAWRGDKTSGEVFPLENLLPDLHIRHRFGNVEVDYLVECKYRSAWGDGIDLSGHYFRYHNAAADRSVELFFAIGVGGSPSAPDDFFLIPARMLHPDLHVDRTRYLPFSCPRTPAGFHAYLARYFAAILMK